MKEKTLLMEKRQKSKLDRTVCSPIREKFRGKKGFAVLRISPHGLTQQGICYSIAGKLFSTHYSWFLTLHVIRCFLVLIWSKCHCFLMLVKQKGRKTKGKLVRMWTKRGVGHGLRHGLGHGVGHGLPHGLPYGPPYSLPVVIFFF